MNFHQVLFLSFANSEFEINPLSEILHEHDHKWT